MTSRPISREEQEILQYAKDLEQAREEQREIWYDQCVVPCLKLFENFERALQPAAFDAVKKFQSLEALDKSLVLLSPTVYGVGKTHLVCALAESLVETRETAKFQSGCYRILRRQCPVHFTTELKLLARIRQTYNRKDGETEEDVFLHLDKFPLLIIDDVGKVRPRDYSFLQGVYFRIIDERYVDRQGIILTTNLSLKELEEHIGGASADRLREMCGKTGFITMKGQSYRKNLATDDKMGK